MGHIAAADVETRTQEIERGLLRLATEEHTQLTTLNRWTKQVLAWCLADPRLKAQVLRFIDCLPTLRTPRSVVQHLREYLPPDQHRLPVALRVGVSLSRPGLVTAPVASLMVHRMIEQVARQFIAANHVEDAGAVIRRLAHEGVLVSLDVLGEDVMSDAEADAYAARYAELIQGLPRLCGDLRARPSGRPLVHLSVKPSALACRFDPVCVEASLEQALRRLRPLVRLAVEHGVALTLDMEQYERRDLTLELARRLLGDEPRLQLGVVIQAYLRDAEASTEELIAWLRAHQRRLAVRLVKGAYWDYEVARALQRGWPVPVYQEKRQTDAAFERLTDRLAACADVMALEIGSHNLRSIAHAMAVMEHHRLPPAAVEFQLLYGMGDAIQRAITRLGYAVRVYAPLGDFIPGMAYLVRRLLENTANESFLREAVFHA